MCGSRAYDDKEYLWSHLSALHDLEAVDVVIEGEAPGADTLARQWADSMGIPVEKYPAQWDKYGKAAGPIRNTQMLVEGKPDLVFAFSKDLASSLGTANMVSQAKRSAVTTATFTGGSSLVAGRM